MQKIKNGLYSEPGDYERFQAQKWEMLKGHGPCKNYYQEIVLHDCKVQINLDVSDITDPVPLHSHSFYEILFCCQGGIDYLVDSQRYRLEEGDIVLMEPGLAHRPLFPAQMEVPYVRYALWLDAEFFQQGCALDEALALAPAQCRRRGSYLLRTTRATWTGLRTAFDNLWRETQQQRPGWQACVAYGALMLMAHLGRTAYYQENAVPAEENDKLLATMFRYIDTHLGEKITLEDMARHCLVSKSTVSHAFHQQLGVPFYQCVIQRRLIAAKNSILSGAPLHQAAEESGFPDYSSFYRLFKQEYGLSPREFLAMHKQKSLSVPD